MTLRRRFAHIRHKHMNEGMLRDVLMEIKDVQKPLVNLGKQYMRSASEISKWGTTQPEAVSQTLTQFLELEGELDEALTVYLGKYERYASVWQQILSERKELNALLAEHKKARKAVKEASKGLKTAEKKERKESKRISSREDLQVPGSDADAKTKKAVSPKLSRKDRKGTVIFAKELVQECQEKELRLRNQVMEKRLEVQKQVHSDLRRALNLLCQARLDYAHEIALAMDRALVLVRKMSTVKSIKGWSMPDDDTTSDGGESQDGEEDEDGDIPIVVEFEPCLFDEPPESVDDVWFKGAHFKKALDIERDACRAALEMEHKKRDQLLEDAEKRHTQELEQLTTQLHEIEARHENLLKSLKEASQEKEATLEQRLENMTASNHELSAKNEVLTGMLQTLYGLTTTSLLSHAQKSAESDLLAAMLELCTDLVSEVGPEKDLDEISARQAIQHSSSVARKVSSLLQMSLGVAQTLPLPDARKLIAQTKELAHITEALFPAIKDYCKAERLTASVPNDKEAYGQLHTKSQALETFLNSLSGKSDLPEAVATSVTKAQAAIEDAMALLKSLLEQVTQDQVGRKVELIKNLINAAQKMMQEGLDFVKAGVAVQGHLSKASTAAAQLENRKWVGGLQHCVDNIIENLPFFLETLRCLVTENTKYDELQVATRHVASSSAQLLAVARNVTSLDSTESNDCLKIISKNSEALVVTSHSLLAAARELNNLNLANVVLEDLGNLSSNEVKKLVMATQINVLRLEKELSDEREKMGRLRRMSYEEE